MLEIGNANTELRTVLPQHTAAHLNSGTLEVLATPMMIAWMEECCLHCVQPCLAEGQTTVGTAVSVTHEAPTPLNGQVKIACVLRSVDGRRLTFAVEASDSSGIIGRGSHERFIVDARRFQEKCNAKAAQL
ncbi:MAG: thioesterase family protein [Clostridia bacterium]|nr:thioesterase family protein [Clostridia bacterium]